MPPRKGQKLQRELRRQQAVANALVAEHTPSALAAIRNDNDPCLPNHLRGMSSSWACAERGGNITLTVRSIAPETREQFERRKAASKHPTRCRQKQLGKAFDRYIDRKQEHEHNIAHRTGMEPTVNIQIETAEKRRQSAEDRAAFGPNRPKMPGDWRPGATLPSKR